MSERDRPPPAGRPNVRYRCQMPLLLRYLHQHTGLAGRMLNPHRYEHAIPGDSTVHVDIKELGSPDGGGHRKPGRSIGNRHQ